jgi:hypothetical protein
MTACATRKTRPLLPKLFLFVNVIQPRFELQDSDIKIDTALTDF